VARETLTVPDIGGAEDTEVIEVSVAVGDRVELEQSLIVLESDKASMEIPATLAGTVVEVLVKEGDSLVEGAAIVVLDTDGETVAAEPESEPQPESQPEPVKEQEPEPAPVDEPAVASTGAPEQVVVPDIGTDDAVEVIEIMVAVGDTVAEGDSVLVLESDKASMEIPAPFAGEIISLAVGEGDQVSQGAVIYSMRAAAGSVPEQNKEPSPEPKAAPAPAQPSTPVPPRAQEAVAGSADVYAGPAVRKLAREFGVDLGAVGGSGPKGRILKEDVQGFVKTSLRGGAGGAASSGAGIPPIPEVDFSAFGDIDIQPLSKLAKLTAANLQRSWLNVPHVTQFDDVDITELEAFRADMKPESERRGTRLTPLPFLLKACAVALRDNPRLNASMGADGESMVYKQYIHIGMAVATPAGLLVPVLRDVDQKSLWELAAETADLAERAKNRKLMPSDMQGGCFTISSLGGIGGTGFTPIVNAPEVAILGVSKLAVKPVWNGSEFEPRKMLPLALSYDHRAVNGADSGRFMTQLGSLLADIRRLLL